MNERELRDNEFRADMENALHQNRSLTMIAQTIWELAKAYADARESKASNKVAEIRRLCKAFLYDLPCSHNVAVIGDFLDAYADNKILDEFKKKVVAAKDTEIAELKAQIRNYELRIDSDAVELDKRYSERTELNAEIKRLRDGIQKGFEKLAEIPYCSVLRTIFDNANGVQNGLESLLSPAPVTEGPKKTFSLQMYGCNRCEWYGQVGESIETESYDVCPKCLSEDLTLLDSPKNEDQE